MATSKRVSFVTTTAVWIFLSVLVVTSLFHSRSFSSLFTPNTGIGQTDLHSASVACITIDSITTNTNSNINGNTTHGKYRKFVSYTSSTLEQLWLDNADTWETGKQFCHAVTQLHPELIHKLLNVTCTSHFEPPYQHWCIIDDGIQPLWYNRDYRNESHDKGFPKGILRWERPLEVPHSVPLLPDEPVTPGPDMEDVVSKFVFLDETTGEQYIEYIEPLASHLRFPLCRCIDTIGPAAEEEGPHNNGNYAYHSVVFKGWLIPPPPPIRHDKAWYFDAGASSWDKGLGGPSLIYFYHVWQRHGLEFDEIRAFEMTVPVENFYHSVPPYLHHKVFYEQTAVVSKAEEHTSTNPFLPTLIQEMTTDNDYVLFKLDIDSPGIEVGSVMHILDSDNSNIDEFFWEHHTSGNYLLSGDWGGHGLKKGTLRESMDLFLRLRQKGIRAHSWV